jgi:hypothetical protein
MARSYGIFQPDGALIEDSVRLSRRHARRSFADENGTMWGHLWELGYRVRVVHNRAFPFSCHPLSICNNQPYSNK